MQYPQATFYLGDLWGYDRIEVRDVNWSFETYAQFASAVRVEYTERGKRKRKTAMITTVPLIILQGWGHPEPPPKWTSPSSEDGSGLVQTTRRLSCDPEWQHEFDAFLAGYLAGSHAVVLADFRMHVATQNHK